MAVAADLRMPVLGLAAWAGALLAALLQVPPGAWVVLALAAAPAALVAIRIGRRPFAVTATAAGLVLLSAGTVTAVRHHQVRANPVADLAADRVGVDLVGTVTSDPRHIEGRFGDLMMWRLDVRSVFAPGRRVELATPVLVLSDGGGEPALGAKVRVTGRLEPADGADIAAVLRIRDGPETLATPSVWWRAAAAGRASIRAAVAHRPPEQAALVPALVVGDDADVDGALAADFETTGLTHLLAVSGTNLTLLVGFLLVLARWSGVRGRGLYLVGAAGIVGFVLLARTEPSVLRAAAMGSVGLLAMGSDGRQRGARALGVAVVVLVLLDPDLAISAGFALSVLATAGILLLAPGWRDLMARWLPRWLAEAVAVPAAAQLACTPIVAALSGTVSLVAVGTNLVVAPVVGPATVLGLSGGLIALPWEWGGRLVGTLAGWCVGWIVLVARRGAALPTAAVEWGSGPVSVALLTVLTLVIAVVTPVLLARRTTGIATALALVAVVGVRPPSPGWPPSGWQVVACDVGQGDAIVVRAGGRSAVVVDTGPDPAVVDRCLDRLDVEEVPLLVLTHFHADHVDGLTGILAGRDVRVVETTNVLDPPFGVERVREDTSRAGVDVRTAAYGSSRRFGEVVVQVLWPPAGSPIEGPGDGSAANDASVVLLVEVAGTRVLLTGDVERETQAALAGMYPGLTVDVLKLPHHGSRYQDHEWLASLGARVVLVSAGRDNDYGHPASATLEPLEQAGAKVLRTDEDGDVAVAVHGRRLEVVTTR